MDENVFKQEMTRVEGLNGIDPEMTDYFSGYKRGLQRAYHGERSGNEDEHKKWLGLYDMSQGRRLIGLGYRHGLKGQIFGGRDYCKQGAGDCEYCSLSNYGRDCRDNQV